MEFLKRINPGILLLGINGFLATFALSFIPLFLKQKGFSISEITLLFAIYTGLSVIMALLTTKFFMKKSVVFGLFMYALSALVFAYYNNASYLLYCFFIALTIIFFWIPLNHLIFRNSNNSSNASDSSVYIVLPGVIAIILPPVSSYIITYFGYKTLFLLASTLYILAIFLIKGLVKEEVFEVKLFDSIKSFKGFKTISLIEGSLHFLVGAIIPIYSLMFFNTEKGFGYFLSYLGIIAFLITLFIAKQSDKTRKRKRYLYILLAMMSVSLFILPFAKTKLLWVVAVIPLTLFYTVSYPIRLAILLDRQKPDMHFWKAREIFLNLGRVITLGLSSIFFYYQLYWAIFVMYGLILIPYIFLVEYKLKHVQ